MNYRHGYHAGNFADVFKHAILGLLLRALRHKDKGFCCIDAYAGAGRYNLRDAEAQKTGEYRQGIARLWRAPAPPAELDDFLRAVEAANPGAPAEPRRYPGSPELARAWLRPQDRLVLLELHDPVYRSLLKTYRHETRIQVRQEDAWQGLKSLLPPPERRGLVLIDPPYERPDEFAHILDGLREALRRWATGLYAIWYPVKERAPVARFHRGLRDLGARKILCAELLLYPDDTPNWLNGCGMAFVNPPWQLPEQLQRLLPYLAEHLRQDAPPAWKIEWLVAET